MSGKPKTVQEWRVKGPNSVGTPFRGSRAVANAVLKCYAGYVKIGHVHTLQRRKVTVTPWGDVKTAGER